jgi:hypothetical protein
LPVLALFIVLRARAGEVDGRHSSPFAGTISGQRMLEERPPEAA